MKAHPFILTIDGEVDRPIAFRFRDLLGLPAVERVVRLDCAGGPRDDTTMKGTSVEHLLSLAGARDSASRAAFHCGDGHREVIPLVDLVLCGAFLVYSVDGQPVGEPDQPVRLAIPGKFGHLWAKWVQRIELLSDDPANQAP